MTICSGYMAPEYAMHGHFSVKSDVYSFGVLVLEIVTGQKNTCFRNGENVEDLISCVSTSIYWCIFHSIRSSYLHGIDKKKITVSLEIDTDIISMHC